MSSRHDWNRAVACVIALSGVLFATSMSVAIAEGSDPAGTTGQSESSASYVAVDFPFALTLDDAIAATGAADVPIVGYRFTQPGLEGEFYVDAIAPEAFLADFQYEYETQPEIVAAIVAEDPAASTEVESGLAEAVAKLSIDAFRAPAPVLRSVESIAMAPTNSLSDPPLPVEHPWTPGPSTFIYSWRDSVVDSGVTRSTATIETNQAWMDGHDPETLDPWWVLEIDVSQYNPELGDVMRPLCPIGYLDDFWASRTSATNTGVRWWAVETEVGDPIDHSGIGAYWDWVDTLDACERQAMAIGIAHPQEIPLNAAGVPVVVTRINTFEGTQARTLFGAGVFRGIQRLRVGLGRNRRRRPHA